MDLGDASFRQIQTSWQQEILLWGSVRTLCDTATDGGGWVTIQRRTNSDINFFRNWIEYKKGFGNLYTGFWIGNDNIHKLTLQGFNELRVELMFNGKPYFALYSSFSVASEEMKYQLSVSGYSGTAGDSLQFHNKMFFTTFDRDNDKTTVVCTHRWWGAWWYKNCYDANLNGMWGRHDGTGLSWETLSGDSGVEFSEMKLRRVEMTGSSSQR
ncbi:unnamed protein product [Candidula unifasciata]|uniref:Fibrinogen C-terminal domain-containing protein n=1 Tax=Candidula unifasciata TaxID=100452 RepID=A0A8S3YM76_9EUPU|nr:unnamed protein product [Candidula unifasciata]